MSKRFGRNKRRKARFEAELFCKKLEAVGRGVARAILATDEPDPPALPQENKVKYCFYDNPKSGNREQWVDGEMVFSIHKANAGCHLLDSDGYFLGYGKPGKKGKLHSALWQVINTRNPAFIPGKVIFGDRLALSLGELLSPQIYSLHDSNG